MSERPFDTLTLQSLKSTTPTAERFATILAIGRLTTIFLVDPFAFALSLWFENVCVDVRFVLKVVKRLVAVLALVGHHFFHLSTGVGFTEVGLVRFDDVLDRRCIADVAVLNLRRDDDFGVQIDSILSLVLQRKTAVFYLANP